MTNSETSRYVRLRVELVLEVEDPGQLRGAALARISEDEITPAEERMRAVSAVRDEAAEAVAYLVEPFDLVKSVPGVSLTESSWTSEEIGPDFEVGDWEADDDEEGDGWNIDAYDGDVRP